MLASKARGRRVVSTSTAAKVAKVDGFVVDARTARVAAVTVRGTRTRAKMLRWTDVKGFGADAVTIESVEQIIEPDEALIELASKNCAVLRKKVLSTAGVELGQVRDLDIDPETGLITALVLADGQVEGSRLLGAGPFAVVVRA